MFLILGFVSVLGLSVFAFDYPSFPGFPQGMEYVTDLDIGQQWIHNTPYGGIACTSQTSNGAFGDNRILTITNVSFSKYYATYEFDISGYACDTLYILFPFYVDSVLYDNGYTFQYEVQTDLPRWTTGVYTYPLMPLFPDQLTWYTFGLQDLISPDGFYRGSVGGNDFDFIGIIAKGITDNTTYHASISVIYIESVFDGNQASPGNFDFWHSGRSTDFGNLSSSFSSVISNGGIASAFTVVTGIINDSAFLTSALWLIVAVNAIDILYEFIMHG